MLVAAVGRPGLITPDMVKPGAAVVDVGITRTDAGLVGDVDPAVAEVAGLADARSGRRRADDDRDAASQHRLARRATARGLLAFPVRRRYGSGAFSHRVGAGSALSS